MRNAFTIAELVVIITIVGLLSTIGVISYTSYTISSRDSVRIANLQDLQTSIELKKVTEGDYTEPDDSFSVTFDGNELWRQGIIGETMRKRIQFQTEILDPKYNTDYTYSISNDGKKFEIGTILENPNSRPLVAMNSTYANESDTAYLFGNLQSKFYFSRENGRKKIFSIPSMTLRGDTNTDLYMNQPSINFSIDGQGIVPATYVGKSLAENEVSFTPQLLFYGESCGVSSYQEIENFTNTLRNSYNYEPFLSSFEYKEIFEDYDKLTNSGGNVAIANKIGTKINNYLDCNVRSFYNTERPNDVPSINPLVSTSITIAGDDNSGRQYTDGTYAQSCNEYRNPSGLYEYSGDIGDGIYNIQPESQGVFRVYCDMETDGGGWTLLASAIGEGTSIFNHNDIVNWVPKNSDNCSVDTECLSESGVQIQDWNDLLVYTRGYKVKGVNCNDESETIYNYSQMEDNGRINSTNWTNINYGAIGKCDEEYEVSQGLEVSHITSHSDSNWTINMGVKSIGNETGEKSFLFYGPVFIPQGLGTSRGSNRGKMDNYYGSDQSFQTNPWDGASTQKQVWFIR